MTDSLSFSQIEVNRENLPEVVIITGMSGAGRTEAMHVFEDLGYFCVDNLPASLIVQLIQLNEASEGEEQRRLAIVCDARNGDYFSYLKEALESLDRQNVQYSVLFLDADEAKLVSRYKSSRRRHPLCEDGTTIAQGIQRERMLLSDIRSIADVVIDTSEMMPQELRNRIRNVFSSGNERKGLSVTVFSFGFKHGAPVDADLVIDVRFLPNPYYDPDLRMMTGLDDPVKDFVMMRGETVEFEKKWHGLLDVLMPGYVAEGKQQLAIGIGCTGGQHRSVAIAESTADYLKSKGYRVSVMHRDLGLAQQKIANKKLEEAANSDMLSNSARSGGDR